QYMDAEPSYPTLVSVDDINGTPIPWSAISGLAAHPSDANAAYAVEDSAFGHSRIFTLDLSTKPAQLTKATTILDSNDVFAALNAVALTDSSVDDDDASRINVFDEADLAAMINGDKSINIDPEGIAVASDGGFWITSEGSGTAGDAGRPINSRSSLFKTDANGVIQEVILLPNALNDVQLRFGFEGVAEYAGKVYVAFQRAWNSEANPRIGIYDTVNQSWSFAYYPLDATESQNGGWVGLSDMTSLGDGSFLMLERDNQGGPDAAIKRLYRIDLSNVSDSETVGKTLVRDLIAEGDLTTPGGLVYEKIEGATVLANSDVIIVNDNDGVDDNSGETQLINLGKILN
ncbi:MAG: esterase-like activity of phytase family protein, partial [Spongiibacteraceae bacterium]